MTNMNRAETRDALDEFGAAREKWLEAIATYKQDSDYAIRVLLLQSSRLYLSVEEVSRRTGLPARRVRKIMRESGLNPYAGGRALSQAASDALIENSEKLGVDVTEMDLMSPLAYLPAGDKISRVIERKGETEQ